MLARNLTQNEVRLDTAEDVPFNLKNVTIYVHPCPEVGKAMTQERFDYYNARGLNMVWIE